MLFGSMYPEVAYTAPSSSTCWKTTKAYQSTVEWQWLCQNTHSMSPKHKYVGLNCSSILSWHQQEHAQKMADNGNGGFHSSARCTSRDGMKTWKLKSVHPPRFELSTNCTEYCAGINTAATNERNSPDPPLWQNHHSQDKRASLCDKEDDACSNWLIPPGSQTELIQSRTVGLLVLFCSVWSSSPPWNK